MFYKVKNVTPLPNYKLSIQFSLGVTKIYNMSKLIRNNTMFHKLKDKNLFNEVVVDTGGYGIVWNDDIDISCNELFDNGKTIKTPFDGLMSFSDATEIWKLNESTLRKAITYGKLVNGIDVCKYGKQWVIRTDAMKREYGLPRE